MGAVICYTYHGFMSTPNPRRQTIVILIVCVVAVAGTWWYTSDHSAVTEQKKAEQARPSVFAVARQDVSGTALTSSDWKKAFIESTSSVAYKPGAAGSAAGTPENLTATQKFSQDFFTQYVNMKQLGLSGDSGVVSSTVSTLLAQDYSSPSDQPRQYSDTDIHMGSSDDTAALRAYGNALGALMQNYAPTNDDASLALAGLRHEDPNYVQELAANVTNYKIILAKLLAMPVPPSLAEYHLGLVNGASDMISIASAFQASETDPMRAISALSSYQNAYQLVLSNILYVDKAFIDAGISYGPGESGSALVNAEQMNQSDQSTQ